MEKTIVTNGAGDPTSVKSGLGPKLQIGGIGEVSIGEVSTVLASRVDHMIQVAS